MPLKHIHDLPLAIDRKLYEPAYKQIANRIYCMAMSGQLSSGDLLPQIRNLAAQLGVNPNTVARAYGELERAGVIRKRQGSGCYVTGAKFGRMKQEPMRQLRDRIEQLLNEATMNGLSKADLIAEIERVPTNPAWGAGVPRTSPPAHAQPALTPATPEDANAVPSLWSEPEGLVD